MKHFFQVVVLLLFKIFRNFFYKILYFNRGNRILGDLQFQETFDSYPM